MKEFLKRKCLVASVLAHGLVLILLAVSPAFSRKEKQETHRPLKLVSSSVVDQALATSNPSTQRTPRPSPPEPRPKREEPKPAPKKQTEPRKPIEPKPKPDPSPAKTTPTPKDTTPAKPKVQVSNTFQRNTPTSTPSPSPPKVDLSQQQRQFDEAMNRIQDRMSKSTDINVSGDNQSSFISYAALVKAKYDSAWIEPSELKASNPTVRVEITVLKSGKVELARILNRSGVAPMDQSVDKVLKTIDFIAPFPENVHESKKTFHINFNLKSKQGLG